MISDRDPTRLIALLHACVVRIDGRRKFLGTGFFVAPGRVVTCAHVVRGAPDLLVTWRDGGPPVPGTVAAAEPPLDSAGDLVPYPLPDLAVINLDAGAAAWDHPCVRLAPDPPTLAGQGSVLLLVGYTDDFEAKIQELTGVSARFESETVAQGHTIYKFKDGQVRPGLSGSPVLDLRAGAVAGITDATRNKLTDLGGFAIPVTELAALPGVVEANKEFHRTDTRWTAALEAQPARPSDRARLGLRAVVVPPPGPDEEVSAAELLSARYPIVEYVGRRRLLEDLAAWREREAPDGAPVGLCFVTADGGYGKTRFAVEACVQAEPSGWTTGLLSTDATEGNIAALAEWPGRLLLVIDQAETRPRLVARLVSEFAARAPRPPVRILLLARHRGTNKELLAKFNEEHEPELGALLRSAPVHRLDVQGTEVDRVALFRRASADFAAWSASRTGTGVSLQHCAEPPPSLRAPYYARPLYVLAAAYLQLNRQPAGTDADTFGEIGLLRALLDEHECLYWKHVAGRRELKLDPKDQRNAVAVATLLTAEGDDEALTAVGLIPHHADDSESRRMELARWLSELYPAATAADQELRIAPLEPDRLGEVLVADVLSQHPSLLPDALDAASDQQLARALTIAARAARGADGNLVVRDQLRRALDERLAQFYFRGLGARATQPGRANPELFNSVVVAMLVSEPTEGALALDAGFTLALPRWLQEHAVGAAELAASGLRELVGRDPARGPELVTVLSRLSTRLRMTGRWEEAAECAGEAVSRCRELATDQPGALQITLAVALNGLVAAQLMLRSRVETEARADEAVALGRTLAAADPAAGREHLAASLRNLAQVLGGPRQAEALVAAAEAVSIDRELAAAGPLEHLPGLAQSLAAEAVALGRARQPAAAADAAQQAVTIFRSLTGNRGDAFEPELAASLCTLADAERDTASPEQALSTATEAVALLRPLAGEQDAPGGYRAALARSLETLAVASDGASRPAEALDSWREAADICRRLASAKPEVWGPDLASALAGLGAARWQAGQLEGALATAREARSIHQSIAETRPQDYRPERARLLTLLAIYLADARIGDEALSVGREAVHEFRQLTATSTAYRNGLVAALTNLAGFLVEDQQTDEAVRTAMEAVGVYESGTDPVPVTDMPVLAQSLQQLAGLLLEAGRADEAVGRAQQAVALLRDASERSRGELPGLTAALLTLAACLKAIGRAEEALPSAREAADLDRELAATTAMARARLGDSLGVVARLLDDLGRRQEADDLFEQNLAYFTGLAEVVGPILLARGRWRTSYGDLSAAIDDLVAAVQVTDSAGDRPTRGEARSYLRHLRGRDSSAFDRAWAQLRIPLPGWLRYLSDDDQLFDRVTEWVGLWVPADSEAYLEDHADLLLTDEAEAALEHLIDANPGTGLLQSRLEILRAARSDGIGHAFAALTRLVVLREKVEVLEAWLRGGSWQEARDFAVAHAADLVHPVTLTYFDEFCAEHPETLSFRLHRGVLHFAAEAPDHAAGFLDAYELGTDAGRLRAALNASDPPPSGRTRLALARMYSGQHAGEPEAHFLLATVLLGGEEPGQEEFGPREQSGPGTPEGHSALPGPEHLAEARAVLADCAENAAPYELRDFAGRLATFLAQRPGLEPYAAEFQRILIEHPQ